MAIWVSAFAQAERRWTAHRSLLAVFLACGIGLFAQHPAEANDEPASQARQQLLLYYGDETSTQAVQSENYAALLSVLRGSSSLRAATVVSSIISDAENFPRLVQRDIDALQTQAERLGFDLAIFTNALAFDGNFLLYRAETGVTEKQLLPPVPPAANMILANSPLSRPEYLRAALFSVSALYPKNSLDIVLITNSHGGRDMALIPRVNADLSQSGAAAAMREMLATGDNGEPPPWAIPQGTTKLAFWQIIGDASSTFGVRFPLVFREICVGGMRSWTEYFAVPSSVELIADSGREQIDSREFDYASMLGNVSPGSDWIASLAEALKGKGVYVNTWGTAWIGVFLLSLSDIPIVVFFAPLALWIAWYAVASFNRRRRRMMGKPDRRSKGTSIPVR